MSDIFSPQPPVDNTNYVEVPTAQDTQQFFANRKQRGQEQWQQEQDYKQKANIGITIAQSFLTTMVNEGFVNMGHLDCPTIKTILNDGDFTSNKIDQYSLEDLRRLVGEDGEIVRFVNAASNRLNRERVLRQKGGVRVKPSSEKTGRSHNPDVQAEQYDDDASMDAETTLQQDNQAQPNATPKPDSEQPEQAGKAQLNDKQADGGPKDFPPSSSFYEEENSHANNGQALARQGIHETFGSAETAVKEAIGIAKTLQFDAGAFPCEGSVKTEPSDQAQASEECLLYPIGKVKLSRLQLIEMMQLGNIYTIRLSDQALKELKETATEELCPHCVDTLIKHYDCVIIKQGSNGNVRYQSKSDIPISKALIYWANAWSMLCCFLDDPTIEISNNEVERLFRRIALAKKCSMFFNGSDGAQAFALLHSITNNCLLNGINVEAYILWLICNIQRRLVRDKAAIMAELKKFNDAGKATTPGKFLVMPHKRKVEQIDADGQKQKISYDLFDIDNNQTIYDMVDITGLLPQDYKALLDEHRLAA